MERVVEKELLDALPPDDSKAIASRQDLRRLNWWMGHGRIVAQTLGSAVNGVGPQRVVELGAGDGEFMLGVGRRLSARWPAASLLLVDQHDAVAAQTRRSLAALPWPVEYVKADVFDWIARPSVPPRDQVVIANLFLHHFDEARLSVLLRGIARVARVFVALEPRRSRWSFAASRQLWALRCNAVTRLDAPASVRAGFAGNELSSLWPPDEAWQIEERQAGWFSHLFVARLEK
jgi:hypothetical protein